MKNLLDKTIMYFRNLVSKNETRVNVNQTLKFLSNNELYFYHIDRIYQNNINTCKYSKQTNTINIPGNFSVNVENKKIYEKTNDNYGNNALDIIISHELGHQTQHQFLKKQESVGNWNIGEYGDICLTKTEGYNQKTIDAQDFFKANNSIPNGIERFMQQNFMESYADCYSGLITYLKNDSKDIFDKIKTFRELDKNEIKDSADLSMNDGQVLKGNFATTEYFNFHGIQKFKDNFINNFKKDDILNIARNNFEAVHHIIQVEALDGLYKTMKEEAKNNNLFLLELKDFCQTRHNCSINTFFDKFESHLNNLRTVYCRYNSTNTLDNNASYFDFDSKCSQLSQKDIIQEYRNSFTKNELVEFDYKKISKLNLNQFPENYAIQQSNYNLRSIKINSENNNIQQNIFNLREKFFKQKTQSKSLTLK